MLAFGNYHQIFRLSTILSMDKNGTTVLNKIQWLVKNILIIYSSTSQIMRRKLEFFIFKSFPEQFNLVFVSQLQVSIKLSLLVRSFHFCQLFEVNMIRHWSYVVKTGSVYQRVGYITIRFLQTSFEKSCHISGWSVRREENINWGKNVEWFYHRFKTCPLYSLPVVK